MNSLPTAQKDRKVICSFLVTLLMQLFPFLPSHAFRGSEMESGRGYYLFNIYQAKFLGDDGTLQALNVGMPECFMATEEGFVVCGTTYQARKNDAGYYQLIDLQEYQEWMSKKKFTLASFNETDGLYY